MKPFSQSHLFKLFVILIFSALVACSPNTSVSPTLTTDAPEISETTAEATIATGDEILVVTGEFAPFSSEALEGGGFATEIVQAVFNEMGRSVRIEFYPWERGEAMVASGEAWGTFPYIATEERQETYDFTDRIDGQVAYFFRYGDAMQDVTFSELSDLQAYRIGGSLGYWYLPLFEEAGLNVEIANDDVSNLRKLQAGRIDLVPIGYVTGSWLINTEFPEDAEQFGFIEPYIGELFYDAVMVSRDYPNSQEIISEFNAALARVIESGEYQEIVGRYGLDANQLLQQTP